MTAQRRSCEHDEWADLCPDCPPAPKPESARAAAKRLGFSMRPRENQADWPAGPFPEDLEPRSKPEPSTAVALPSECVHCGEIYPGESDREHWRSCAVHPAHAALAALRQRVNELEEPFKFAERFGFRPDIAALEINKLRQRAERAEARCAELEAALAAFAQRVERRALLDQADMKTKQSKRDPK